MAETLICTHDWLRNVNTFIDLRQEPEDYKKYENIEKGNLLLHIYPYFNI